MNKGLMSVDEALECLLSGARAVAEIESVPTLEGTGRVLAESLHSTMNVPPMDNSAMDGYAVRLADVPAPGARLRIAQRIMAGSVGGKLGPGTAARIFTGAPIPEGTEAIVLQEHTSAEGDTVVVNTVPAREAWIRRVGIDIRSGDEILAAGSRLRPQDTGLAASVGIASLPVRRKVRLGLFFTGDELLMPGEPLAPGRIYNSNRFTLNGLAQQTGCEVRDYGIVPDNLEATRDMLRRAASECDVIVTSGGVSVGDADFVKPAVEAEGELLMWRIAMKPGRPLAFGQIRKAGGNSAAFIGLPGNPVASFVTFLWFVRPFVMRTQGMTEVVPLGLELRADFDWAEADVRREFLRARRNASGGLDLYPTQDSSVLNSTSWSDGLIDNPGGRPIRPGDRVKFYPYSELFA